MYIIKDTQSCMKIINLNIYACREAPRDGLLIARF